GLGLGGWLWLAFDRTADAMQFVHHGVWIRAFHIEYFVGVDGLSAPLVILSSLIGFVAMLASMPWWGAAPRAGADGRPHFSQHRVPGYCAMLLLLQTGVVGVFAALDFFLFYVFWELMLLPMYFLIGIWGGPRREYAAIKFFLYTLVGSVLMLLAILAVYLRSEPLPGAQFLLADGTAAPHTFNMLYLAELGAAGHWLRMAPVFGAGFATLAWLGFFAAFAVKVPMVPFHTWLPDAHVEAPTPISVLLAGVLLKMGVYGLLRVNWALFPQTSQALAPWVAAFGATSILYAAFICLAQRDLKRLIAYSSVSHMGFCLLGIASFTPQGVAGAVLNMWTHGIISPMLFLVVGVLYDRAHHREIDGFGGIAKVVPEYTALMGLAFFASLGLPGLAGFVAEFLVLAGAFGVFQWMTALAALGVVITAAYYLWTLQRVFLGPLNARYAALPDLNWRE
ncbi:MAG: NuoM family protein, partial [Myxococcales bacterium]